MGENVSRPAANYSGGFGGCKYFIVFSSQ